MNVRVGLWRNLSTEELMLLNCGVREDSWESLGLHKRSNQSILNETSLECSLEGLMLRLKLQYSGHLMWRVDSLEKISDAGRDWGQEEKGTTEDEMAGWYHWLDAHEFGWILAVGDGHGGLACCDTWGRKESDKIERLNWTEATDLVWAHQIWTFSTLSCLRWVTWLKGTKTIYTHIETVYSNKIFLFPSLCQHKLTLSGNSCLEGESWSNYCLFLEVSKKKKKL